jgi:hypothetical protein
MARQAETDPLFHELNEDDRIHIRTVFEQKVVPRLAQLGARMGNVNCGFAGEGYKNWSVQFRSAGSDFEIVDFEWDEEGEILDLDL